MSNSKLTKSFNFTLGCIVPFSGVTPTKKPLRKSKRMKNTPTGDEGGGMEKDREREKERERQTTTTTKAHP